MAIETSGLDLHYLISEMKVLEGSKIDKISQPEKDDLFLQFYVRDKGKIMLRIKMPSIFYLPSKKPETPEKIHGFCSALRKYLSNSFIEKIEQVGSERIAKLEFKAKEGTFNLFVELFAKGNIILCKKDGTIIVPLNTLKLKDRTIKAGEKYAPPMRENGFLSVDAKAILKIMKASSQNISKTLAIELGLGGSYSKEVCAMAGIDEKVKEISETDAKKIVVAVKKLVNNHVKDISKKIEEKVESDAPEKTTKQQKQIQKLQKIIDIQEKKIKELSESADENQKKGEAIYNNYSMLNDILNELKKIRKEHSWKEIKEKLKNHKTIKDVNETTGEITIEI